ncbi:phage tail spike protein [Lacticaseibacillus salsurivasis]|uniref:phage tail spike protein n=1 Tax=Lacticaseibacillus salsurivasis TaxID=3081441 RepID=UPI0030C6BA86
MIAYFANRDFELIGIASTDMPDASRPGINMIDDVDDEFAETAVGRSYTATLVFGESDVAKVMAMAAYGNFVLYKDYRGRSQFMTIAEWTKFDAHSGVLTFVSESGGLDLINETISAYSASRPMTFAEYFDLFTTDSGFEIGTNEIADLTRTLSWDSTDDTSLKRIESVATQFDNAELNFRFEVDGMKVVKRYVDVYKHIGADKGQRLEVNTQLNSISTTGNIYDLYTSVVATGDTVEGSDKPLTLAGYSYTDPTGRYVLTAGGVLMDTVANQKWSRLRAAGSVADVSGGYINRRITYTAKTQAELFQSALAGLKKAVDPVVNYEADVAELPSTVEVGDTVHLVDELQDLNLSTRLLELKTSYANDTRQATFGDFLIEQSQIDPALQELADKMEQIKASNTHQYYPWTRYADDDVGTGISADPAGKTYMAVVWSDKSAVPSDDPADYAGHWQKVKGDDGVGVAGPKGDDGKTSYFHTAYADDVNGGGFSQSPTGKAYIGTYSDFTETDSTTVSDYTWVLIKGANGAKGDTGPTGPAGKDITSYASGTVLPSSVAPANSQFWLLDSTGIATAFYKSDGTKWVAQPISASAISAATFNGLTFNGVIFNGSKFISTFKNAPVDESDFADVTDPTGQIMLTKGTGTTKMGDGYLTVDGTIDGSSGTYLQTFHTEIGPAGYLSRLYDGGTAESDITAAAQLYLGELLLSNLDASGKKVSGHLNGEMLQQLDNVGRLLWSGKTRLGDNQSITPSLPLSKCLNGWKIGLAMDAGNRFFWEYISKERALKAPNLGHLVPIFDFNLGGGGQYYYVSDTKLTGNSSINLKNSVGSAYYIYEIRAF